MNQRIRYSKAVNGIMTSRRVFTTSAGLVVTVELDTTNKKYSIVDAASGAVVTTGGKTKNLAVLKIQAKEGLSALGVTFAEELRTRDGLTADVKRAIKEKMLASVNG